LKNTNTVIRIAGVPINQSLYYPLDAWFIKTTAVKDRMVELNKTINWKPASTGDRPFWQLAGEYGGLEPQPQPLLGNTLTGLANGRRQKKNASAIG
jgi:hypothetical protein